MGVGVDPRHSAIERVLHKPCLNRLIELRADGRGWGWRTGSRAPGGPVLPVNVEKERRTMHSLQYVASMNHKHINTIIIMMLCVD